jgi:hypothetical protein
MRCVRCHAQPHDLLTALVRGWGRLDRELGLCPACSEALGYATRWTTTSWARRPLAAISQPTRTSRAVA